VRGPSDAVGEIDEVYTVRDKAAEVLMGDACVVAWLVLWSCCFRALLVCLNGAGLPSRLGVLVPLDGFDVLALEEHRNYTDPFLALTSSSPT